jgi:hypothetical protein
MFFINLSTKNKILEKDYIKKEKKLIMEYEYVNENLLEFTQKYQKTSFYGNKFLKSYFENRIKIINQIKNNSTNSIELEKIIAKLKEIEPSINELDLEITLSNILIKKVRYHDSSQDKIIEIFLKKFEIKKRLFSKYDLNFKEIGNDYKNLRNYVLLSTLCCLRYKETKNLIFLNVILKINDTLISQFSLIKNKYDLTLLLNILINEIDFIEKLCKNKGIEKY